MKSYIRELLILGLVVFIIYALIPTEQLNVIESKGTDFQDSFGLHSSTYGLNQSDIDDFLDDRLSDYNQYGRFQEYYSPSIRDTYFALYVLDAIGKLHLIDEEAILNYFKISNNSIFVIFD